MSPTLRDDEVHRAAEACIAAVEAVGHEGGGRFSRSVAHA
jgi:hypothetical protein